MFKAFRLALGLKQATDAQLQSIGRQAYTRLQAIAAKKTGKRCRFDGGDIVMYPPEGLTQRYPCGFVYEDDWLMLLDLNQSVAIPETLHSYADEPNHYRFEGFRFAYPPTCNVKYIDFQYGAVVDLGAITA
jgi:hypothetical protein